jgi:hydroxymethylpyrimidine kinase/phosphomethylpyrimidine kinase
VTPESQAVPETRAILAIAGSDPSGGAGIQADLKTLTMLGVYGGAAVTTITVQNTVGVTACHPLDPELVHSQVVAVLSDLFVTHVKIGMIGSEAIGQAIVRALQGFSGEVIYDPVIFTSVGPAVKSTDSMAGIRLVAARATVLTPNRKELGLISGAPCLTTDQALAAGRTLFTVFPQLQAVVVKGGHLDEEQPQVTDYLLLANTPDPHGKSHRRVRSANTHGTGCTFASAMAAMHQRTGNYRQAFDRTVAVMDTLITLSAPWRMGHGSGGLSHHLYPL